MSFNNSRDVNSRDTSFERRKNTKTFNLQTEETEVSCIGC